MRFEARFELSNSSGGVSGVVYVYTTIAIFSIWHYMRRICIIQILLSSVDSLRRILRYSVDSIIIRVVYNSFTLKHVKHVNVSDLYVTPNSIFC